MGRAIFQAPAVDDSGNVVPGATVVVTDAETGDPVDIYADRTGGSPLDPTGQTESAADGMITFYTEGPGRFDIEVTVGASVRTLEDVVLFDDTHIAVDRVETTIALGATNDWDGGGSLNEATGVLDINPTSGNATITGIDASRLRDGQEVVVTNIHATNTVTLSVEDTDSAASNRFRGFANVTLLQYMSVVIKKSTGANRLLVIP